MFTKALKITILLIVFFHSTINIYSQQSNEIEGLFQHLDQDLISIEAHLMRQQQRINSLETLTKKQDESLVRQEQIIEGLSNSLLASEADLSAYENYINQKEITFQNNIRELEREFNTIRLQRNIFIGTTVLGGLTSLIFALR